MKQILLIDDMADVKVFHLAFCHDCGALLMPFTSVDERDEWSMEHSDGTGHIVDSKTEIRIVTS